MRKKPLVVLVCLLLLGTLVVAQDFQRRSRRGRGRIPGDRNGVPMWNVKQEFSKDVFTFARVRYSSYRGRWGWETDYPDADLNLSYRLQEMTSLNVDPRGAIVRLTDPELFEYPFIYIVEPGGLTFNEAEVLALRRYLNKGGFLLVDDFWGEYEWENFESEMARVLPDRSWEDVPLEHEIFHIVYDLEEKPIIPSIHTYYRGMRTERYDANDGHYRAYFDDDRRIMVFVCHNTDLGDGWEREGVDRGYFERYSEKYAYPLGINIVTYAMTH